MWSVAIEMSDLLLSYSVMLLASHPTIILISTLFQHINISVHLYLQGVGLHDELVCSSLLEYEELAVSLATDSERLMSLRKHLEAVRTSCATFDTQRWVSLIFFIFIFSLQRYGCLSMSWSSYFLLSGALENHGLLRLDILE